MADSLTVCIFWFFQQTTGVLAVFDNVFFLIELSGFLYHNKEAETELKYNDQVNFDGFISFFFFSFEGY